MIKEISIVVNHPIKQNIRTSLKLKKVKTLKNQ